MDTKIIIKKIDEILGIMATKDDLKVFYKDIIERIDTAQMEIIQVVDEHKVDKTEFKSLEKRVTLIEEQPQAS